MRWKFNLNPQKLVKCWQKIIKSVSLIWQRQMRWAGESQWTGNDSPTWGEWEHGWNFKDTSMSTPPAPPLQTHTWGPGPHFSQSCDITCTAVSLFQPPHTSAAQLKPDVTFGMHRCNCRRLTGRETGMAERERGGRERQRNGEREPVYGPLEIWLHPEVHYHSLNNVLLTPPSAFTSPEQQPYTPVSPFPQEWAQDLGGCDWGVTSSSWELYGGPGTTGQFDLLGSFVSKVVFIGWKNTCAFIKLHI